MTYTMDSDLYRDEVTYREDMAYTMDSDLYRDEVTYPG